MDQVQVTLPEWTVLHSSLTGRNDVVQTEHKAARAHIKSPPSDVAAANSLDAVS